MRNTAVLFRPDIAMPDIAALSGAAIGAAIVGRPALDPARLGKITASQFHRITYSADKKRWSEMAKSYMAELVMEHATGLPASNFDGSAATDWGHQHEPAACAEYERRTGQKVVRNKFLRLAGSRLIGGTPDAIGIGRSAEFKCPYSPKNHIATLLSQEIPSEYLAQVRGQALIANVDWVDFVSFDPRYTGKNAHLGFICLPYEAEPHEITALKDRLLHFEHDLLEVLEKLEIEPIL